MSAIEERARVVGILTAWEKRLADVRRHDGPGTLRYQTAGETLRELRRVLREIRGEVTP